MIYIPTGTHQHKDSCKAHPIPLVRGGHGPTFCPLLIFSWRNFFRLTPWSLPAISTFTRGEGTSLIRVWGKELRVTRLSPFFPPLLEICLSGLVNLGSIAEHHRPRGGKVGEQNNRHVSSHSSGGWKSKIKVLQGQFLVKLPSWFLCVPLCLCLTWSSLCGCSKRKASVSLPLLIRTPVLLDKGPTPMMSLNFNYLLNIVTLGGVKAFDMNFGAHNSALNTVLKSATCQVVKGLLCAGEVCC